MAPKKKRTRRAARPARRWRRRGLVWLAKAGIVLAAALLLAVLPWRYLPPPTTSFMLQSRLAGHGAEQRWVPWERISPELRVAVVAAEDQRFPAHRGFDWKEIGTALQERRARTRGASTISQQVAKNLYLWPGRSWLRKGLEVALTVAIESLWPKRRILEMYLNVAEFDRGVFGVGAACLHHFGRPAGAVSAEQAARLAAVLPDPKRLSAGRPSPWVTERAAQIRQSVRDLGGPGYLDRL